MATLKLTGSVGTGTPKSGLPHNNPEDVAKVRDRFIELGYTWVAGTMTGKESEFIRTIKLFNSTCKGSGKADNGDGRVDRHGVVHRWLAAQNAPGWVDMTDYYGIGWQRTDLEFKVKNSHTTTWMHDRIIRAGFEYKAKAINGGNWDFPPLWIRDLSPPNGGGATGHKSHETGIDVDMRLPLLPPNSHLWTRLQGHKYTEKFHRQAALIQVEAIWAKMDPKNVWFNDPEFAKKNLSSDKEPNHGNHYHIRIKPPIPIEGDYL